MSNSDLLEALRRLKVETGSLACLGCGHEHNCSTLGCAILRAAEEALAAENKHLREEAEKMDYITYYCPDEAGGGQGRTNIDGKELAGPHIALLARCEEVAGLTNADVIRRMTDEELAEMLSSEPSTWERWLAWLQAPVDRTAVREMFRAIREEVEHG